MKFLTGALAFSLFNLSRGIYYIAILTLFARQGVEVAVPASALFIIFMHVGGIAGSSVTFRMIDRAGKAITLCAPLIVMLAALIAQYAAGMSMTAVASISFVMGFIDSSFRASQRTFAKDLWLGENTATFGFMSTLGWGIGCVSGPFICSHIDASTFLVAAGFGAVGLAMLAINLFAANRGRLGTSMEHAVQRAEGWRSVKDILWSYTGAVLMSGSFLKIALLVAVNSSIMSVVTQRLGLSEAKSTFILFSYIVGVMLSGFFAKSARIREFLGEHYSWPALLLFKIVITIIAFTALRVEVFFSVMVVFGFLNSLDISQLVVYVDRHVQRTDIGRVQSAVELLSVAAGFAVYVIIKVLSADSTVVLYILFAACIAFALAMMGRHLMMNAKATETG